MILNRVQAASVLILATLFIVPSLAFPANADVCYRAELFYEESAIGWAKLIVSDGKQFLKVEIVCWLSRITILKIFLSTMLIKLYARMVSSTQMNLSTGI